MLVSRRSLVIEWGDCDPAGIVFYPRYFAYFDTSTWTLLTRAVGMSKAQMLRHYDIIGCPMVDTRARFLRPSTFGDEVTIETSVSELRRSSFDVRHRLLKADELAVEGFETPGVDGPRPDESRSAEVAADPGRSRSGTRDGRVSSGVVDRLRRDFEARQGACARGVGGSSGAAFFKRSRASMARLW
jgi:4-hydroxybenzoyl-CoA thioesterase